MPRSTVPPSAAPFVTLSLALALVSVLAPAAAGADWDAGVAAFRAGRFGEAVAEFRTLVEQSPEAAAGHYMWGLSLLRQKQPGEALAPLGRALELEPEEISYRLTVAQAELEARRGEAALDTLRAQDPAALGADLRRPYGRLLARAATGSERPELAAAALRRALDADPESRELWRALAQVLRQMGETGETYAALAAAFALDPADVELGRSTVRAAFVAAREAEGDERRRWYREGAALARRLAVEEATAEHQILAGEALMGAGDYAAARPFFDAAAAAGEALPRYYLGRCELALDRPAAALEVLDQALGAAPEADLAGRIHAARGVALHHLRRFDQAAAAYRRAADPARAAEMERLAQVQEGNKEWAADKARCEAKRRQVEAHLDDNRFLEGTQAWRDLERWAAGELAGCEAYLGAAG